MENDKSNEKILPKIVFFPHPVSEHKVTNKGNIMEWNINKHCRKFMEVNGAYTNSISTEKQLQQGKISFWGEWESESTYTRIQYKGKRKNLEPNYIHNPQCYINEIFTKLKDDNCVDDNACFSFYAGAKNNNKGKQNTDPYVFGNQFMYSCCKQQGNNPLKDLHKGDIIVFYGQTGKYNTHDYICHIDTIFVVGGIINKGKYCDMLPNLIKDERITNQFIFKTILPIIYGNKKNLGKDIEKKDNVLYYGATYDNPVNGMFSYFPCKVANNNEGYKRFEHKAFKAHKFKGKIGKTECYPDNNVSTNNYEKASEVKEFWGKLTDEIITAGYLLGVKANEPEPINRKN